MWTLKKKKIHHIKTCFGWHRHSFSPHLLENKRTITIVLVESVCLADACAGFVTEVYGPELNWDMKGLELLLLPLLLILKGNNFFWIEHAVSMVPLVKAAKDTMVHVQKHDITIVHIQETW